MTPTLLGRWQQRLFLLVTVGLPITLLVAIGQRSWSYGLILLYLGISGCLWDILYQQLQKMRWDQDWPGLWQMLGGAGEGLWLLFLLKVSLLPGLQLSQLALGWLIGHYVLISLAMFLAAHSLTLILFPHARFRGRQWL